MVNVSKQKVSLDINLSVIFANCGACGNHEETPGYEVYLMAHHVLEELGFDRQAQQRLIHYDPTIEDLAAINDFIRQQIPVKGEGTLLTGLGGEPWST